MLYIVILAVAVPAVAVVAYLTHAGQLKLAADSRGIALQTVIIMVVLLAIAGGIAAVLLNRGTEAANELEGSEIAVSVYTYTNASLCRAGGGTWVSAARSGADLATDTTGLQAALGITPATAVTNNKGYCHE